MRCKLFKISLEIILCGTLLLLTTQLLLAQQPQLRVWLLKTYVPPANKALEQNIQRWAAKNNVKVKVEYFTYDTMSVKYTSGIETRALPDIGEMEETGPARYHAMGILRDVTDLVQEISQKNEGLYPNLPLAVQFGGRFYSVPHYVIGYVMFLRKDLLENVGAGVPQTWEEVYETAKKIKHAGYLSYPLGQAWTYQSDGYATFQSVLYSYGASFADKEGNFRPYSTQERAREAIKWATDIYLADRVVPPDALAWKGFSNNENWFAGKIAITFNANSIWYRLEAENHPLLEKTLVALDPAGPGGRVNVSTFQSFGIFKQTKYPELAESLIRYLLSKEAHARYIEASYGQVSPAYAYFSGLEYYKRNPTYSTLAKVAKYTSSPGYPGPVTAAAAEVIAGFTNMDMLQSIIIGAATVDEAMKKADKKIADIYKVMHR